MFSTPLYPIFLSLTGQNCLVAGFGQVGQRKLKALLPCQPLSVTIVDPMLSDELEDRFAESNIIFKKRSWEARDIAENDVIFAATGDMQENMRIAEECKRLRKLCNSVTQPNSGNFTVPATIRKGSLCVAISTGGASPLLAALYKQELQSWMTDKEKLIWIMGKIRSAMLETSQNADANASFFKSIISSSFQDWLKNRDWDKCRQMLCAYLPVSEVNKILAEYADVFSA